jgi:hypothetical protein
VVVAEMGVYALLTIQLFSRRFVKSVRGKMQVAMSCACQPHYLSILWLTSLTDITKLLRASECEQLPVALLWRWPRPSPEHCREAATHAFVAHSLRTKHAMKSVFAMYAQFGHPSIQYDHFLIPFERRHKGSHKGSAGVPTCKQGKAHT